MWGMKIILAGAEPGEEWGGVSWKTRGGEDGVGFDPKVPRDVKLRPRLGLNLKWVREESSAGRFGVGETGGVEIHPPMRPGGIKGISGATGFSGTSRISGISGIPGIRNPSKKRDPIMESPFLELPGSPFVVTNSDKDPKWRWESQAAIPRPLESLEIPSTHPKNGRDAPPTPFPSFVEHLEFFSFVPRAWTESLGTARSTWNLWDGGENLPFS